MESLVTVYTCTYPHEAHMAKGYLASEGVQSVLKDELSAQLRNFNSAVVGGVKVQVRAEDYEQATQILQKGGYLVAEKSEELIIIKRTQDMNRKECPFCHSTHISKNKDADPATLLFCLLFGLFIPDLRLANKCSDCGKNWKFRR